MPKVTLIGLGKMGSAIASSIISSGLPLTVYNRTQSKAQRLVEQGAISAPSIKEAITDADFIISCLLDDKAMLDVATSADGIVNNMKQSAVHIGTATILPETAQTIAQYHQKHGRNYVSTAVLGVPKVALKGELTTFCAGDEAIVSSCQSVLTAYTKAVIPMGCDAKAPLIMKICMNYSLATSLELISELYSFAEKSGLDKEYVQQGLYQIYGHPAFQLYIDKIKERNFDDVNFDMQGGMKDLKIFQKAFADVGVMPKLGDLLEQRFTTALKKNMKSKDWSAISEVVRHEAGLD